jgi:hypothetical protein
MAKSSEKTKATAVKKAAKGKQKAEKIFHPESRKAGQMEREALRKAKLANKLVKRGKKQMIQGEEHYLRSSADTVIDLFLKKRTNMHSFSMQYLRKQPVLPLQSYTS